MSAVHRPRRRLLGCSVGVASLAVACVLGPAAWMAPTALHAGDDWSLEHKASDPELVAQRFAKLRRSPFDPVQWRALRKAVGTDALAKRIESALERAPDDIPLRILQARAALDGGDPSRAARTLAEIEPKAGRWRAPVFEMRIDALVAAGEHGAALSALTAQAESSQGSARIGLLERAHALADRAGLDETSLRLARQLADHDDGLEAQLRLARAASRASEGALADDAFARAIEKAPPRRRDDLVAERARARLDADNPTGASDLMWSLLESPRNGTRAARAQWWSTLAQAHQRDGSIDVLIARLRTWLERNDDEPAAWRTLAQAQQIAGLDPVDAWKKTAQLGPRDTESRAALVEALETKGDTKAAVREYLDLLSRHPSEIELGLDIASRLVASGERELALDIVRKIEAGAGGRPQGLSLVLDFYNLNDEPDLALAVARRMVKARPRSVESRIALGEQLYQMNRVTEALAQWAMLPQLIRPQHKGWARHTEVLSEHGRTAEAVATLKKALEAAPDEPGYWRLRAVLAEEQRRPQTAMQAWEEVRRLAKSPEHALLRDEARTRIVELLVGGSIANRRMRVERAEADARSVIGRALASRASLSGDALADAIEAGKFLAELHTRRESYSAAVGVQQLLLQLRPDDPEQLAELATAQRRAGQTQSALETLELLLAVEPGRSADVLAEMSELAFEAGDPDRALKTATRAATKDRSQVDALVRLGELHERDGDVEEAARAYDRALETTPSDLRARLRLAELELTRGNPKRSGAIFREILESNGPPELLREAGRRALDLAEASDSALDLLDLVVRRATLHPEAAEPRELVIDALDRVSVDQVHRWLSTTPTKTTSGGTLRGDRTAALRRPLVTSLGRGSVGARMRAAEHLGALGLPDTALPLARMAAQLAPPRDATATVRDAFERARTGALRAAGALQDPAAVPVFIAVLDETSHPLSARHAAAWALARVGTAESIEALLPHLRSGSDPLMAALGCIALAGRAGQGNTRAPISPDDALTVAVLARDARHPHVRHVCALGEAALTPDAHVDRLVPLLQSSDPALAAVAAWRLGRVTEADGAIVQALLRRFVGPPGLPRDAAGAALANLLGPKHPAPPLVAPPPPRGSDAAHLLERWLVDTVAPRYASVDATAFAVHHGALHAALRAGSQGTRAERAAAAAVLAPCPPEAPPEATETSICLAPLVEETLRTKPASR